jgi:hypothetical protein
MDFPQTVPTFHGNRKTKTLVSSAWTYLLLKKWVGDLRKIKPVLAAALTQALLLDLWRGGGGRHVSFTQNAFKMCSFATQPCSTRYLYCTGKATSTDTGNSVFFFVSLKFLFQAVHEQFHLQKQTFYKRLFFNHSESCN